MTKHSVEKWAQFANGHDAFLLICYKESTKLISVTRLNIFQSKRGESKL